MAKGLTGDELFDCISPRMVARNAPFVTRTGLLQLRQLFRREAALHSSIDQNRQYSRPENL